MANSTVTDALTKIFLALGGDTQKLQDDHNLTDYLDDLGDVLVEAVKAELPAVTTSDNGKIMQVKSGKWETGLKFPISISSMDKYNPLCVNSQGNAIIAGSVVQYFPAVITKSGSSYSFEQCQANYAAVKDFVNGKIHVGITLIANSFASGCSVYYAGEGILNNQDAIFSGVVVDNGNVYALIITFKSNDTKTISVTKLNA